jgi:hypothetical protein
MKILRISFLLLFFAMFIITCKKPSGPPPPHQNTFTTTINGNAFVSAKTEVFVSGSSVPGAKSVFIKTTNAITHEMYLNMYDYNGTKSTFTLDMNSSYGGFCLDNCNDNFGVTSVSKSGGVNIVSFGKATYNDGSSIKEGELITGTFQFETDDDVGKYSVTNGNFSVVVPQN